MTKGLTLVFTGGGSGGHIYPGLAIIEELRKSLDARIAWIGGAKEGDRRAVEAEGVEFFQIPSGKLRRNLSFENALDAFRVLGGYFAARRILAELRPSLLFSKGGYVSVPPCKAAASLGIPVFTHESDLSPGLATRLNARSAERILLAYEETRLLLPVALRAKAVVTGNPVRAAMRQGRAEEGRRDLGLAEGTPLVLVLGGSQGAVQVNELVAAALPTLTARAYVVHQTGEANIAAAIRAGAGLARPERYRPLAYIRDELPDIMAAATILVTRAGAGSLWEGASLGKPLVLIPLAGSGTRGDQKDNARHFAEAGAAKVLVGAGADPAALAKAVLDWIDDPAAREMAGRAARNLAGMDGAAAAADLILERTGA